jgi:hypothetical protein
MRMVPFAALVEDGAGIKRAVNIGSATTSSRLPRFG